VNESQYREWMATLKPGDRVVIDAGRALGGRYSIETISAVQKLHVVIDRGNYKTKFRRDTGYRAGERGSWNLERVVRLTAEIEERVQRDRYIRKISTRSSSNLDEVSTERLRRIVEILKEHDTEVIAKTRESGGV
jgi:hypothetical protein